MNDHTDARGHRCVPADFETLHDALARTIGGTWHPDEEPPFHDTDGADAVLAMPQMQQMRSCIATLASLHYLDGYLPRTSADRHRLAVGLEVGGGLSAGVIAWILDGADELATQETTPP